MRSNLSSLKSIATQMDRTQDILSTGKKVNSAIDNATNFYQARALTNRAADLNALLDAMGQGIQTIQAATEGLEAGTKYLEQAKVLVDDALVDASTATVEVDVEKTIAEQNAQRLEKATGKAPDRAWLLANGADYVVENEAELRAALTAATAGQKIVVNSTIDIEVNDAADILVVAEGVELVGATALSDNAINADGSYKGQLNIVSNIDCYSLLELNAGSKISNLTINGSSTASLYAGIFVKGGTVDNINLISDGVGAGGAINFGEGQNYITGNVNVVNLSKIDFSKAIHVGRSSLDIEGNVSAQAVAKWGHGLAMGSGVTNIKDGSSLNILTKGEIGVALDNATGSVLNIGSAKLNLISEQHSAIYNECWGTTSGGNTVKIKSGAEINAKGQNLFVNDASMTLNTVTGNKENYFEIEAGVKVFFESLQDGSRGQYISKDVWTASNVEGDGKNVYYNLDALKAAGWEYIGDFYFDENSQNVRNYQMILGEYDRLIADSSYQGINLLTGGNMTVTFNESRSNKFTVEGINVKSEDLGIKTKKWISKEDVETSLNEINVAINSLRDVSVVLGNNYTIIQTRQDFTEALTDVLETGADSLVLADMNEASAQYLMLQTRQQLAVNSLSLASQSAQSILRLF